MYMHNVTNYLHLLGEVYWLHSDKGEPLPQSDH